MPIQLPCVPPPTPAVKLISVPSGDQAASRNPGPSFSISTRCPLPSALMTSSRSTGDFGKESAVGQPLQHIHLPLGCRRGGCRSQVPRLAPGRVGEPDAGCLGCPNRRQGCPLGAEISAGPTQCLALIPDGEGTPDAGEQHH